MLMLACVTSYQCTVVCEKHLCGKQHVRDPYQLVDLQLVSLVF